MMEAGEDQLPILNKAIERWPAPYYAEAVKASVQRCRVLELRKPSTTELPLPDYVDPVTLTVGLNKTPWVITDKTKHFVECDIHKTRMTQKKGLNKNNKPYCRYDCAVPGCDVGGWHSDIFGD